VEVSAFEHAGSKTLPPGQDSGVGLRRSQLSALVFDRCGEISEQCGFHRLKAFKCVEITGTQRVKFFFEQMAKLRALLISNGQL